MATRVTHLKQKIVAESKPVHVRRLRAETCRLQEHEGRYMTLRQHGGSQQSHPANPNHRKKNSWHLA